MSGADIRLTSELDTDERADARFRSGFGCIRCGATIYYYAFLGTVQEAMLLCPSCVKRLQSGNVNADQLAALTRAPVLRQSGFSKAHLPFSHRLPVLRIGGSKAVTDTPVPLRVDAVAPLMFAPPRRGVGAVRISLRMTNASGRVETLIDNNEYVAPDGWTYAWLGKRMTVAAKDGPAILTLRFDDQSSIAVETLVTAINGRVLEGTEQWIDVDGVRYVDAVASGQLVGLDV